MSEFARNPSPPPGAAPKLPPQWIVRAALVVATVLGSGNFNEGLAPKGDDSNLQQYPVLLSWIAIAAASAFMRPVRSFAWSPALALIAAPYAMAALSPAWSDNPAASIVKAGAFAAVTFAAYRLALTTPLAVIVDAVVVGLAIVAAASIALALFVPSVGLATEWMHEGLWNGVFESKQTLGINGALLLFFSSCRLGKPTGRLFSGLAAAAALACVIGSGSRGGGALAIAAIVAVWGVRRSTRFAKMLAFFPFAMSLVAVGLMSYFIVTGAKSILILDTEIDFTERTFIWQYALGHFGDAPLLGFGLDGFWTQKDIKDLYLEQHGWFLDNYHDGYIAVLMETGTLGFVLFMSGYFMYGVRVVNLIGVEGRLREDVAVTLSYVCMLFFIDFTETFFLRSTNLTSALIAVSLVVGLATGDGGRVVPASRSARPVRIARRPARRGPVAPAIQRPKRTNSL